MSENIDSFLDEMFNETLIEEVQKYPCIYNYENPDFSKPLDNVWSEIALVCNSTATHCKERWKDLQQKYVEEHLDAEPFSDWAHSESMDFMREYILSDPNLVKGISKKDIYCRACMRLVIKNSEQTCKTYNIFETADFCEKFIQCTNLETDANDEYPHSVCSICYEQILDFYQFNVMCHESQEKFNVILEEEMPIKLEIVPNKAPIPPEDIVAENDQVSLLVEEKRENQSHDQSLGNLEETPGDDPLAEPANTSSGFEQEHNEYNLELVENWGSENVEEPIEDIKVEKRNKVKEAKKPKRKTTKRKAAKVKIEKVKTEEQSEEEPELKGSDNEDGVFTKTTKRKSAKVKIEKVKTEEQSEEEPELKGSDNDNGSVSDDFEALDENKRRIRLKCDQCPKIFYREHVLEAHQREHMGLAAYPCTFENCYQAYNSAADLRRHLNSQHGIVTTFKCNIENCDQVFRSYRPLNEHKRKIHKCGKEYKKKKRSIPKPCVCETCGKFLSTARALKIHRLGHLDKSQWPYACDEEGCTRRFVKASLLTVHKKRHAGIKEFACPYCGMRKTTRHELNIHINFHTFEKKYPCRICSKVFKSVGMVSTHIHKAHEGIENKNDGCFNCSYCDRKLSTVQSKIFHEMTHTGEKPYACQECDKTFRRPANLNQHKHMHLKGEKPYVCTVCGEKFKWPGSWKLHMKLHSEERAHACEECGKKFKWPSNLVSHKKLHVEGATPYVCEECGQGFRWPGSLYTHKKKHLGQKTEDVPPGVGDVTVQS